MDLPSVVLQIFNFLRKSYMLTCLFSVKMLVTTLIVPEEKKLLMILLGELLS